MIKKYSKILGVLLTLALLLAVLPAGKAQAATLEVGPGKAYTTIQGAIDAANPGDTIEVAAGTYNEALSIQKAITIQGLEEHKAIIDGTGLEAKSLVRINGISSGEVKFDGFKIINKQNTGLVSDRPADFSLSVSGGTEDAMIVITNNQIIASDLQVYGIYLQSTPAKIKVNDNIFENHYLNSIGIELATNDVEVGHNLFTVRGHDHGSPYGVRGGPAIFSMSYGSTATPNTVTGLHWYHDNVIEAADKDILYYQGIVVAPAWGETKWNQRQYGAYENVVIEGNDIKEYISTGIQVEVDGENSTFNGEINNNTLTPANNISLSRGIRLLGPVADTKLIGNVISNGHYGIWLTGTWSQPYYPTDISIQGNRLAGNVIGYEEVDTTNSQVISPNWWGSIYGPDEGYIVNNDNYSPWCGDAACTFVVHKDPVEDGFYRDGDKVIMKGEFDRGFTLDGPSTLLIADGTIINADGPCFDVKANNVSILTQTPAGAVCKPGSPGVVVADGVDQFELVGLEIDGTDLTEGHGVEFEGDVTNVWLVNNYIHNMPGDGAHFTSGLGGIHNFIQGNLFKSNGGAGVFNGGTVAIDARYNSWGHIDGAVAGDGIDGDVDWSEHTHVDLYLGSSGTHYENQVVKDDEITYTVYGNLANIHGVEFTLVLPEEVEYVDDSFENLAFNFAYFDDLGSGKLHLAGDQLLEDALPTPIGGEEIALFEIVLSGVKFGKELEITYEATSGSFAHKGLDWGPTNYVYLVDYVEIGDLEVIDLPVLSQDGLDDDLFVGVEREFEITLENPEEGGAFDHVLINFLVEDASLDDILSFECYETSSGQWLGGLLSEDGNNLVGTWGPSVGFPMDAPYGATTQCRVNFKKAGDYDVAITLVDIDTAWELAKLEVTIHVKAGTLSVIGTVMMQGRTVRSDVPAILTSTLFGDVTTSSGPTILDNLAFTSLDGGEWLFTTQQERYLNVTTDLGKKIVLTGDGELPILHLYGGNVAWKDGLDIVNLADASLVGTEYGNPGSTVPTGENNADANFDGKVNIQDLALVGGNYNLTSAAAYGLFLSTGNVINLTTVVNYETLAEAIVEAADGDALALLDNLSIAEDDYMYPEHYAVMVSGKSLTLDLFGHTLSSDADATIYISGSGSLHLKDSVGGGVVLNENGYEAIGNYGVFVMESGKLHAEKGYALYNYYYSSSQYGTATLLGGKLTSFDLAIANSGVLTIHNATIQGNEYDLNNSGHLTIAGELSIYFLYLADGSDAKDLTGNGTMVLTSSANLIVGSEGEYEEDAEIIVESGAQVDGIPGVSAPAFGTSTYIFDSGNNWVLQP